MHQMVAGFTDALSPQVIGFISIGIVLGYFIGVLPGLNRPVALAVAIPLTYYMSPLSGVAFLIGIAKASGAGGATTAILLNTPGEPNAAVTCFDGYPLARAGAAKKALKIALYGSVIGDIIATIVLIFIAQPLASIALRIGPVEMTAIMVLSLMFIAALSGKSLFRGLAAGMFGIFLSTVGLDMETSSPRMTFGHVELLDGIPLIALTIGMLGLTEMLIQAEQIIARHLARLPKADSFETGKADLSWMEFMRTVPTIFRSSAVGTGIGILPGLGPSIASFVSYALAERLAKPGDTFRKGDLKGVAAAETADNAAIPASLIPLFSLGLPGSISAAIILAAFMMHGMTPGPRMFAEHGQFMYAIYAAMLIASVVMLIVGRVGLVAFAMLTRVPSTIVIPVVIMLCVVGAYVESHSVFAVQVMIGMAILGYFMERFDYSRVTFLIGFIVGPLLEASIRQTLVIIGNNPKNLVNYPVAMLLFALAIAAGIYFLRSARISTSAET